MDVLGSGNGAADGQSTAWVAALTEWIGRDAHPRFIINPDLDCLWKNDAARRLLGESRASTGEPIPKALNFFNQLTLKTLIQDAEDGQVHWRIIPNQNDEKLIVWAKALGDSHERLFGLVLMPPDHEQSFREFFENARLTPAETRIIDAILRGETLANTAIISGVSKETIKTQLKNAYRKLSVNSRGELFAEARRFIAP
jgi:DNA-binding CsgD family transcriptional regulator